jgi:hypothetical protein
MADESLAGCMLCHAALKPGELAVFRDGAKIAHVQCWRPPTNHPVDDVGTTESSEQPGDSPAPGSQADLPPPAAA